MLQSGLPELIDDAEDLARFLIHSSHFNEIMVKPAAFLPNPKDRETSVFRHGSEPRERLWQIGSLAAGARKLYGVAIFKAKAVRDTGLDVTAAEPPPRHAVICNWPWSEADRELQKARQKERAVQIAAAAGKPLLR